MSAAHIWIVDREHATGCDAFFGKEAEVRMAARLESGARWIIAAVLAAAGCGGGPGGGGPPPGSGGPWLPFAGGGIFAVSMSAPATAPATFDQTSNVGGLRLVQRGTYDPATGAVSGVEPHAAIWIAGGKIWRASAAAGASLAAAQVSSETSVGDPSPLNPTSTHLCDAAVETDWANPGDSRYLYTLAGSDKQCGGADDVVKSMRVTAAAFEAPVTLSGRRVTAVRSPSTGAITGWLLIDATGRLVRTDAAFANPVQLVASVGFAFVVGATSSQQLVLLQSGSQVVVRRFDPAAGTLDATALFTLPGGISSSVGARAQDATNVYMAVWDGSAGAWSLHRLTLAATDANSAVQMTSESGRTVGTLLLLTTNKVAFTVTASGTDSLVATDKSAAGTAAAPALGAAQPSGTTLTPIAAAADKVYVNFVGASGRSALALDEAGTNAISQANAQWVGFADVGGVSTAVLASGLSSTGSYGGAGLSTVAAATAASGIALGTLPAEVTTLDRLRWSGSKGLLRGFTGNYGEILFADAGTAGSLLRVTNTASVSESLP
jgi:hypothetical protein